MLEDRNSAAAAQASHLNHHQSSSSEVLHDVDLENNQDERGAYRDDGKAPYSMNMDHGDGRVLVETPWYLKLYRNRACICIVLVVFTFIIWGLTSTNKACWAKMSRPHASKRNVNRNLALVHISDDSSMTEASKAVTGNSPNQEIRFLVIGNFGRDGFCYQMDIAYEMSKAARTMKAAFVISTGNAFFPSGIASVDDPQINTSWRDVYNSASLSSIPWYNTLGEAEKLGDVNALLQLSKKDTRFVIDGLYYDKLFTANSGAVSLHAFFLDTSALIRSKKQKYDEQLVWLTEGLSKSNATIKVVVGFHTPFTDTVLTDFLVPILENESYGVAAYFSGRERSLQWYKRKSVHYFISGAGAEMLKNENPFRQPLYVAPTSGFLACTVSQNEKTKEWRLKTAFVSSIGEVSKVIDTSTH